MQEEMDAQVDNAAKFRSRRWSQAERKKAKTSSFQLFNQQKFK